MSFLSWLFRTGARERREPAGTPVAAASTGEAGHGWDGAAEVSSTGHHGQDECGPADQAGGHGDGGGSDGGGGGDGGGGDGG